MDLLERDNLMLAIVWIKYVSRGESYEVTLFDILSDIWMILLVYLLYVWYHLKGIHWFLWLCKITKSVPSQCSTRQQGWLKVEMTWDIILGCK